MELEPVAALFVFRNAERDGISYDKSAVRVFHCLATVTDKYRVDLIPLEIFPTTIESDIHCEASAAE